MTEQQRAAMQAALESLEVYWSKAEHRRTQLDDQKADEARNALRVAITQQDKPTPDAWIDNSGHPKHISYLQSATERRLYGPLRPLYEVAPQQEQGEPRALPYFNRREVEYAIESAENPPPGTLRLNDSKERVTLPGGTLRRMLAIIDQLSTSPPPRKRLTLTPRELELLDGLIDYWRNHAATCEQMGNRVMAERQRGWDLERVELLSKLRAHGIGEGNA